MGDQKLGLDPPTVKMIAQEVKRVHELQQPILVEELN